jgi:hypothetical protein
MLRASVAEAAARRSAADIAAQAAALTVPSPDTRSVEG